jgi:CubicO group peptidase (beta-lactamase class C family)
MTEIHGFAEARFAGVRDAFAANFAAGEELGARFTLVQGGEVVVDLWAGHADRMKTKPFDDRTLAPIFSSTKAVAATLVARLVDAGKITYGQPVAEVWPEFAQGGKDKVTIEQAISHQAGLCGFPEPMDPALWFDWDAICAKLAAMEPLWPPGTASGYHPITFGYIAGEIFRRVDGRTMGRALREDIAEPAGLDLWIGLPEAEVGRLAEMRRPPALPDFGEVNRATEVAFLVPWASTARADAEWRRAEIPSANGHATAMALARLAGALADGGRLDGLEILSPAAIEAVAAKRIEGQDLVLPFVMAWGAGVMRNAPLHPWGPGAQTFGHSGWGGSCLFADPERGLGGAYVMNRQSVHLCGDPRPKRLIEAAYAAA